MSRSDVAALVHDHAMLIAAPDVAELVEDQKALLAKADALREARFEPFRHQIHEAATCLEDYIADRCPQIPYYTITVLAAALFYFRNPMDAVPDFLPHIGVVDDALVMAVATELAGDGLRRYRAWKAMTEEEEEAAAADAAMSSPDTPQPRPRPKPRPAPKRRPRRT